MQARVLQEMRRPAPDIHPRKQQRLDDTPGYSFKELGRFDYRAADAIADGSQGFIITCDFRRCFVATYLSLCSILPHMQWHKVM